jgi:hypothetical protein
MHLVLVPVRHRHVCLTKPTSDLVSQRASEIPPECPGAAGTGT